MKAEFLYAILVADQFAAGLSQTGPKLVADLLARGSSLLAS